MTLKIALLLLALALLAGFLSKGRGAPKVERSRKPNIVAAKRCARCDAYVLAQSPCRRADCPQR